MIIDLLCNPSYRCRLLLQIAFSDWINSNLSADKDVQHLIPLSPDGRDLYQKITDGILLMLVLVTFLSFYPQPHPHFLLVFFIVTRRPVGDYFQELLPSQRLQQWFPGQSE